MKPIIDPWLFYLIGIGENVQMTFGVFAGLLLIAGVICFILKIVEGCWENKYYIPTFIVGSILCLIALAIPPKETCYQMMVASMVTENNVKITKESAKELIDYIIEKIDELNDENEDN